MQALLPYAGILVAAAVEGEFAYVAACALVAEGRLDPLAVVLAGTIGAAAGDQAYFYLFRGRLTRWMDRFPSVARKAAPLRDVVRRRATLATLLVRFAPGFRVALTAACVYADVPALKFSLLNTLTSLIWAVALLALVAWAGPAVLASFGLRAWQGAVVMGLIVLVLFRLLGRLESRAMTSPPAAGAGGDAASRDAE